MNDFANWPQKYSNWFQFSEQSLFETSAHKQKILIVAAKSNFQKNFLSLNKILMYIFSIHSIYGS